MAIYLTYLENLKVKDESTWGRGHNSELLNSNKQWVEMVSCIKVQNQHMKKIRNPKF